jgi:hypothetical protein
MKDEDPVWIVTEKCLAAGYINPEMADGDWLAGLLPEKN